MKAAYDAKTQNELIDWFDHLQDEITVCGGQVSPRTRIEFSEVTSHVELSIIPSEDNHFLVKLVKTDLQHHPGFSPAKVATPYGFSHIAENLVGCLAAVSKVTVE